MDTLPDSENIDDLPSTSIGPPIVASTQQVDDAALEKQMDHAALMEEFLQKSKTVMLDYEKHMFLDLMDTDGLVVCAK